MDKPAKMQNLVTGTDKWTWEKAWMSLFFLCFLTEKCHSSLQDVRSATKIGDSLTFLVVGDWGRKGLYNQTEVAAEMGRIGENLGIDFVISTGDNFYDDGLSGTEDPNFEESFSRIYTAKSLQIPWYSVLGNHDYQGDALAQLSPALRRRDPRWNCGRSFVLKYNICPHKSAKSKECGTVDFFFVDTTPFVDMYWKQSNKKYDWRGVIPRKKYLKQQLQDLALALNASTATWKVMIGHHPIRSIGAHGDTDELVHHLLPLVKGYGVNMYLNGHDHCVEDLISPDDGGLQFLTSGGGSKAWMGLKKGQTCQRTCQGRVCNLRFFTMAKVLSLCKFKQRECSLISTSYRIRSIKRKPDRIWTSYDFVFLSMLYFVMNNLAPYYLILVCVHCHYC